MEMVDFGVSMVVAPAYILHLKLVQTWSFFSFGMAEYTLQAVLLVVMMLVLRRFKISYLFSFVTAFIYGIVLDLCMAAVAGIPRESMIARILYYALGMFLCAIGISLFFHTYIAPEVYELFVKELAGLTGADIHHVKTVYDCASCAVGVLLSFLFFGFGRFEGVRLGTILCALVNGSLIGLCTRFFESRFTFRDGLGLRSLFAK